MLKTVTLLSTILSAINRIKHTHQNNKTLFSAPDVSKHTHPNNKVIRVIDGDTIIYCKDNQEQRGRLSDIDAPETKQEFGVESTDYLKSLLNNQYVTITEDGIDYYGRNLITLEVNGKNINKLMVKHGYAWSYSRSIKNEIFNLELIAQENNLGLWSNPNAINPKQFRNGYK